MIKVSSWKFKESSLFNWILDIFNIFAGSKVPFCWLFHYLVSAICPHEDIENTQIKIDNYIYSPKEI